MSTRDDLRVDVCSKCHPFFTGEERYVDTEGRVERFRRRYGQDQEQDQDQEGEKEEQPKGKKKKKK